MSGVAEKKFRRKSKPQTYQRDVMKYHIMTFLTTRFQKPTSTTEINLHRDFVQYNPGFYEKKLPILLLNLSSQTMWNQAYNNKEGRQIFKLFQNNMEFNVR